MSILLGGHLPCVDGGQIRMISLLSRVLTNRDRVDLELRHRAPRVRGVVFPVARRQHTSFLQKTHSRQGQQERASALQYFFPAPCSISKTNSSISTIQRHR